MKAATARNLHVPMSQDLYGALRAESARSHTPATEIAREAVEMLLAARKQARLRDEIAQWAQEFAGTAADIDSELETVAAEELEKITE